MIAAADVNVADEFEIGEEEMAVFLNQAFDEGVLNQEGFLILLHAKDNKTDQIFHSGIMPDLVWSC